MAKMSNIVKSQQPAKFAVRHRNRCPVVWAKRPCGRPRGYMRQFGMCRICFRTLANQGKLPGVKKSSW
ncbi:MAG: type Z 30S ribosomal protein S14 [Dehalococcoidia bacterium]|jgi:small subunit ribosomal protein S14|nr:type Z 30S ribosomal protein S14 [Dehalococcoidia bacterium]